MQPNRETYQPAQKQRCPIDDGFGVYIARAALLKVDTLPKRYVSDCERIPSSEEIAEKRASEQADDGFLVYPNPTNGELSLRYNMDETSTGSLQVFSATGSLVMRVALNSKTELQEIDLSHVESGLYIVRVEVDGAVELSERISVVTP